MDAGAGLRVGGDGGVGAGGETEGGGEGGGYGGGWGGEGGGGEEGEGGEGELHCDGGGWFEVTFVEAVEWLVDLLNFVARSEWP